MAARALSDISKDIFSACDVTESDRLSVLKGKIQNELIVDGWKRAVRSGTIAVTPYSNQLALRVAVWLARGSVQPGVLLESAEIFVRVFPKTRADIVKAAQRGRVFICREVVSELRDCLSEEIIQLYSFQRFDEIVDMISIIPARLFDAWFRRVVSEVTAMVSMSSCDDDILDVITDFIDSLPGDYPEMFLNAFPFHGRGKDAIIRAFLATEKQTGHIVRGLKEHWMQYFYRRKNIDAFRLGSDIGFPGKMDGKRLASYLKYLNDHVDGLWHIKAVPSLEEFRALAIELLVDGDPELRQLYTSAEEAIKKIHHVPLLSKGPGKGKSQKTGRIALSAT